MRKVGPPQQEWAGIDPQMSAQPPNWSPAHLEIVKAKAYFKGRGTRGQRQGVVGLGSAELGSELRAYALGPHAIPEPIRVGFGKL